MKKKILDYLIIFFIISFSINILLGCGDDAPETKEPNPVNNPISGVMKVDHFVPSIMPNDTFKICIYSFDFGGQIYDTVELKITDLSHNNCVAYDTTKIIHVRPRDPDIDITDTIKVYVNKFNSNCNNPDAVYRVALFSTHLHKEADSTFYVRGNPYPSLVEKTATLYMEYMSNNNVPQCDSMFRAADSTLYYPNTSYPDSNHAHVHLDTSGVYGWHPIHDSSFYEQSSNDITFNMLNQFWTTYHHETNRTYSLVIANKFYTIYTHKKIGGASIVYPNKWSLIFTGSIDSFVNSPRKPHTVRAYSTCHELIHQIGNLVLDSTLFDDHFYHSGRNDSSCVLHNVSGTKATDTVVQRFCGYFRICDYHVFKLRLNLGGNPEDYKQFLTGPVQNSVVFTVPHEQILDKYEIGMMLSKNSYKTYEPVIAKFLIINHDTKPFEIYGLFDEGTREPHLVITDDKGNEWHYNRQRFFMEYYYTNPDYKILPNETLYVSMPINNWGKSVRFQSFEDNDIYFGQYGYFLPGNYKAIYYFDHKITDEAKIVSNEVEFEVLNNDIQDNSILKKLKEPGYDIPALIKISDEIISDYSDNPLIEAVFAFELGLKHLGFMNNPNYSSGDELEGDYERFISKFPNSPYLLKDKFIMPYILKTFLNNDKNLETTVTTLKNKFSNDLIDKFLMNTTRLENIIDSHK